jgi:glutamate dehydrogenase (NADP+)
VEPYAHEFGAKFCSGKRPWEVPVNVAMPCATENEVDLEDAKELVKNGCLPVGRSFQYGMYCRSRGLPFQKYKLCTG